MEKFHRVEKLKKLRRIKRKTIHEEKRKEDSTLTSELRI
jgi:hypothetical protein